MLITYLDKCDANAPAGDVDGVFVDKVSHRRIASLQCNDVIKGEHRVMTSREDTI